MVNYEVFSSWSRDGTNPIAPVRQSKLLFGIITSSGPSAGRRILNMLRKSGLPNKLLPKKTKIESGPGWFLFTCHGVGYLVTEQGYVPKLPNGVLLIRDNRRLTILIETGTASDPHYKNVTRLFAHVKFQCTRWNGTKYLRGRLVSGERVLFLPRNVKNIIDITEEVSKRYPLVPQNWSVV